MTALHISHSPRRRRRKMLLFSITTLCAFLLFAHRYLIVVFNILFRGPYIAAYHSDHLRISATRDDFDITFDSYPSRPPVTSDHDTPVPKTIHQIMLGSDAINTTGLLTAHQACVDMHPSYQFKLWTDETSSLFVQNHFPELYPMWSSYPYTIQKADSLRYMVLYEYGGIFLDLDLECRRPLDPLRRFSFVAPAASPMGISNGFLMIAPRHPFLAFVLENLHRYNVNWLLPYAIVMFTTGCHFLSTMLSLYPQRDSMHILWGPNHMHQLSGAVTTPLFRHLGLSSWHAADGAIVHMFKFGIAGTILALTLKVLLVATVAFWLMRWWRSSDRLRRRPSMEKIKADDQPETV